MVQDLEGEIWRDIKDYEGLYQVSNYIRVKSLPRNGTILTESILKQRINKDGYRVVQFSKNGKIRNHFIHRLVAEAFLENPNNLPYINHKDENKLNNIPENLEWCDSKYNCNYGTRNERIKRFSKDNHASKPIVQIDKNTNEIIKEWDSIMDAERALGIDNGHISACCKGKKYYKTVGGFKWKYKEEDN